MIIKIITEGILLGALLVLLCAVGIRKGAVNMVFLYHRDVQDRCVQNGLITRERIWQNRKIFKGLGIPLYFTFVLVSVYAVNGARGFWPGFWQMFAILSILNLIDRLLIDEYWVGHTRAWDIPGTEDTMKKTPVFRIAIAAVAYLALFPLASVSGLVHPACYAYVGTLAPILFGFVYLYTAANLQSFGAAAILNGFTLIVGLLAGEGNLTFVVGMVVLALAAELVRNRHGYDTLKGVRRSFIPLAFSFYAYSAHWWTNTAESLAEAAEEMPAGYADKMVPVIQNVPILIVMLILTIPVALLGMRLAEKAMKKQAALLK